MGKYYSATDGVLLVLSQLLAESDIGFGGHPMLKKVRVKQVSTLLKIYCDLTGMDSEILAPELLARSQKLIDDFLRFDDRQYADNLLNNIFNENKKKDT